MWAGIFPWDGGGGLQGIPQTEIGPRFGTKASRARSVADNLKNFDTF